MNTIDIVFDGPPSHESGRFVEVENDKQQSINFGDWIHRDDGYWVLRIDLSARETAERERDDLRKRLEEAEQMLQPFAKYADELDNSGGGPLPDTLPIGTVASAPRRPDPNVGDLRRARDFLAAHNAGKEGRQLLEHPETDYNPAAFDKRLCHEHRP